MIKRIHTIILLVIVTALVAGLFHYNAVQAQRGREPTIQRDCVEIPILVTKDVGILMGSLDNSDFDVNHPLTLIFSFSPKSGFLNVTDLWISLEVEGYLTTYNEYAVAHYELDCLFNSAASYHVDEEQRVGGVNHILSAHVPDETVYASIVPSVNNLTLSNPLVRRSGYFTYYSMIIYKITIFVEYDYEYQTK